MSNGRATPSAAHNGQPGALLSSLHKNVFRDFLNLLRDAAITDSLRACRKELRKG